jgi:hypothetical protein
MVFCLLHEQFGFGWYSTKSPRLFYACGSRPILLNSNQQRTAQIADRTAKPAETCTPFYRNPALLGLIYSRQGNVVDFGFAA